MFNCSNGDIDDTVGLTRFDGIMVNVSQISLTIKQDDEMIGKIYKMNILSIIKITIAQILQQ